MVCSAHRVVDDVVLAHRLTILALEVVLAGDDAGGPGGVELRNKKKRHKLTAISKCLVSRLCLFALTLGYTATGPSTSQQKNGGQKNPAAPRYCVSLQVPILHSEAPPVPRSQSTLAHSPRVTPESPPKHRINA